MAGRQNIHFIGGNQDPADVQRRVEKAQQQVARAMQQVRDLTRNNPAMMDSSDSSESSNDEAMEVARPIQGGGAAIRIQKTSGMCQTNIVIEKSKNVQVGNHNVMVINNTRERKPEQVKEVPETDSGIGQCDDDSLSEPQKKLLQLTDAVDERIARTVTKWIGQSWRRIFRKLGLSEEEIDQVHHENKDRGIQEVIYQGILSWKQKKGRNATVGKLAEGVYRGSGSTEVIDRLREEFYEGL